MCSVQAILNRNSEVVFFGCCCVQSFYASLLDSVRIPGFLLNHFDHSPEVTVDMFEFSNILNEACYTSDNAMSAFSVFHPVSTYFCFCICH